MELTEKNKKHIDSLSYEGLLGRWRFAPVGDKWMEGETGKYWGDRMALKRSQHSNPVQVSKDLGWGGE